MNKKHICIHCKHFDFMDKHELSQKFIMEREETCDKGHFKDLIRRINFPIITCKNFKPIKKITLAHICNH